MFAPLLFAACLPAADVVPDPAPDAAAAANFARDVRPLLAKRCFACHGPDGEANESGLRLDRAGHDAGADVLERIASDDEYVVMPPPESGPPLTPAEIETLRTWVAAGAGYEPHWAFVPPVRGDVPVGPAPPAVSDAPEPPRNEIDLFIDADLAGRGMTRSPAADRATLARRAALDLVGVPPRPAEADAFAADPAPDAYGRYIDRLLASPRYGERWARPWLDLARYSDTNGYEKDRQRSIWPYRDWVVRALNANLPYDEFSVLQLAGDLIPGAGVDGKVAAGFHRNTMLNEEGGIDPLQFRHEAVVDRVAVTGTVWLGLTTGCAQCHTHKYDPITHTDYYRLFALLNNADNLNVALPDPAVDAARERLERKAGALEAALPDQFPGGRPAFEAAFADWLKQQSAAAVDWRVAVPTETATNAPKLRAQPDGSLLSVGDVTKRDLFTLTYSAADLAALDLPGPITGVRIEALPDDRLPAGGPGRVFYEGRAGTFLLSEVTARAGGGLTGMMKKESNTKSDPTGEDGDAGDEPDGRDAAALPFAGASASYEEAKGKAASPAAAIDGNGSSGWSLGSNTGIEGRLALSFAEPVPADAPLTLELLHERHYAASLGRFRVSFTADPLPLASPLPHAAEAALAAAGPDGPDRLGDEIRAELRVQFARLAPQLAKPRKAVETLRNSMPERVRTLTFEERPADFVRPTFRHHRGEYTSPREPVTGAVPAFLPQLSGDEPADRLALAKWLLSEENPLAARAAVNRAWAAFFGRGFVPDAADFGTQSVPPTHPALLDWLAVEFRDGGPATGDEWDVKRLHRLIVTSATYRQRSAASPAALAADPENQRLARGPRHRLEAELVRDAALAAADLLVERVGGPPVMPPQPDSVTALAYGGFKWTPAAGADRYRRSVYTFSKRTAPFAAFAVFDAPSGELCAANRGRSNTPLQALTLLNDAMFVEYARALAADVTASAADPAARAEGLFRRVLTRRPTPAEAAALTEFAAAQRARLAAGDLDPAAVVHGPPDPDLAAWTLAARAVLNLDEAVTKE